MTQLKMKAGKADTAGKAVKLVRLRRKTVQLGNRRIPPSQLRALPDSSELLHSGDWQSLRARLHQDGVLLLRQAVPEDAALDGRRLLLEMLQRKEALEPDSELMDARIASVGMRATVPGYTVDAQSGGLTGDDRDDVDGWKAVGNDERLVNVYDGQALKKLLKYMFGEDSFETLPHNTWLRMRGVGDVTIEHSDYFYFKRSTDMFPLLSDTLEREPSGSAEHCGICKRDNRKDVVTCVMCGSIVHETCLEKEVRLKGEQERMQWHCQACADGPLPIWTCWLSMSDVDLDNSTLAFVPGSHTLTGFDRPKGTDQTPLEFRSARKRLKWHVPELPLRPGDMFIFNVKTIHCATKNLSRQFRISADTRIGLTKQGNQAWNELHRKQEAKVNLDEHDKPVL